MKRINKSVVSFALSAALAFNLLPLASFAAAESSADVQDINPVIVYQDVSTEEMPHDDSSSGRAVSKYTRKDGTNPVVSGGYGWDENSWWNTTNKTFSATVPTATNRTVRSYKKSDGETVYLLGPQAAAAAFYRKLADENAIKANEDAEYYISFISKNAMGSVPVDREGKISTADNRFIIGKDGGDDSFYVSSSRGYLNGHEGYTGETGYYPALSIDGETQVGSKLITPWALYHNLIYIKTNSAGEEVIKYQIVAENETFDPNVWDLETSAELGDSVYNYFGIQSANEPYEYAANAQFNGCAQAGAFRLEKYTADSGAGSAIAAIQAQIDELAKTVTVETFSNCFKEAIALTNGIPECTVKDFYLSRSAVEKQFLQVLRENSDTVVWDNFYGDGTLTADGGKNKNGRYYLSKLDYSGSERAEGTYNTSVRESGFGWTSKWEPNKSGLTNSIDKVADSLMAWKQEESKTVLYTTSPSLAVRGINAVDLKQDAEYFISFENNFYQSNMDYVENSIKEIKYYLGDDIYIFERYLDEETDPVKQERGVYLGLSVNGEETISDVRLTLDQDYQLVMQISASQGSNPVFKVCAIPAGAEFVMQNWDIEYESSAAVENPAYFGVSGQGQYITDIRIDKCDKNLIVQVEEAVTSAPYEDTTLQLVHSMKDSVAKTGYLNLIRVESDRLLPEKFELVAQDGSKIQELTPQTGAVKAKAKVKSTYSDAEKTVMLFIASYNGKELIDVQCVKQEIAPLSTSGYFETPVINVPATEEELKDFSVSVYIWDENLQPLEENIQLQTNIVVDRTAAPGGNGTVQAPYNSLESAALLSVSMAENGYATSDGRVVVEVKSGNYVLSDTLHISDTDGNVPILFLGEEGAKISGAVPVDDEKISDITDETVKMRFDDTAREQIKQIDLNELGIVDLGSQYVYGNSVDVFRQAGVSAVKPYNVAPPVNVLMDSTPLDIARYPNKDDVEIQNSFMQIDTVLEPGSNIRYWMSDKEGEDGYIPPEDREEDFRPLKFSVQVDQERFQNWTQAENMQLHGFWGMAWSDLAMGASAESSTEGAQIITADYPTAYPVDKESPQANFYVYNVLEELDTPGEYYIDGHMLYFYPPADGTVFSITTLDKPLVKIENAKNISFDNIDLVGTRANGIEIEYCDTVSVENCEISAVSKAAAVITDSQNCSVNHNVIHHTGEGGTLISAGNLETLTPANNSVSNNEIYSFSEKRLTYAPAVKLAGVGNSACNNEIHGSYHMAVNFSGNDHLIENNEIYDVCQFTDDATAIYAYSSKTGRGNQITNNYIHNIISRHPKADTSSMGVHGIYLDGKRDGSIVTKNIFEDLPRSGLWINGGRDNICTDNVFIRTGYTVHLAYNTSYSADKGAYQELSAEKKATADKWGCNSAYIGTEPYNKYEHLQELLDDDPLLMKHNCVERNIIINPKGFADVTDLRFVSGSHEWLTESDKGANVFNVSADLSGSLNGANFEGLKNGTYTISGVDGFQSPDYQAIGRK